MPPTGDAAPSSDSAPAEGPRLDATLIGPPRLVWRRSEGDEAIELPSKPFALLCWLALEPRAVPKDVLTELFWGPGRRHNLRVALHALRKLPGSDAWLRTDGDGVEVTAASDLARFERVLEATDPERAVAIWREGAGERPADTALLAGVEAANAPAFVDALVDVRRRWAERYRAALAGAAQALERRGERAAALDHLGAALAIDPLDEALVRRAMWLEDALGRRPAALARYERLRRELAADMEVRPAAATRELYAALLAADDGRAAPARAADPLAALRGSRRTPFVGRERELTTIEHAFGAGSWVTLHGPGGVGKSRLALEYASRLGGVPAPASPSAAPDVGVVAFERLVDPSAWPEAVAHALGVPLPGGGPALAQLEAALRGRAALLVLDGLEGARAAWPELAALADAALRLRVLATSRVRLALPVERVVAVAPLAIVLDDGALGAPLANDAGRLLLAAARRDDASYDPGPRERRALARIGRAVEGMPLGLELAAGWLRLYGAERLADRIEADPLALEDPDAPAEAFDRGRDPAAAIARSWALLPEAGRRTLGTLAVLRGGFDAAAALAVSGDDDPRALLALVDASLLLRVGDGRFDLHAGVRRWIASKSDPARRVAAGERHADYFLRSLLPGAAESAPGSSDGERLERERLEREHDNVMSAWRWACEAADTALIGAALDPVALYLRATERNDEGRNAMARAVAALEGGTDDAVPLTARARVQRAWFASITGRNDEAVTALEAALPALGDRPQLEAEARRNLGAALSNLGRFEAAARQLETAAAMFEAVGDRLNLARTSNYLGIDALRRGDPAAAHEHYRACLVHARDAGSELGIATALANLGEVALHQGTLTEAERLLSEALERFEAQRYRNGEASTTFDLGLLDWRRGAREAGRARLDAALAMYRSLGRVREEAEVLAELARIGGDEGRRHAEAALALARRIGHPTTEAVALARLAALERDAGRHERHRAALAEARRVAGPRAAPRLMAALRDAEEAAEAPEGAASTG